MCDGSPRATAQTRPNVAPVTCSHGVVGFSVEVLITPCLGKFIRVAPLSGILPPSAKRKPEANLSPWRYDFLSTCP
jgi:hypothetical protein